MRPPCNVALVLLAAGTSDRFGEEDKLLADLSGKHLVQHCVDRLAKLDFGERVAVVRAGSEVAALLAGAGYSLAINHAPQDGIGGSLALGVAAIETAASCLVCLADMPLVSIDHVEAMLRVDADIVASTLDGVNQPPVLFDAAHFPTLASLSGEKGARDLLRSASSVSAPHTVLADIDSVDDLREMSASRRDE